MRTALLLLALLAAPAFGAGQDIWKWVDEKGVTHYSDRAVPGATKMDISTGNRMDAQPSAAPTPSRSAPRTTAAAPYRTLEIGSPQQGESVINTGGEVRVEVRTEPFLQAEHALTLYMDGAVVKGSAPDAREYRLRAVPRGEHTLVIAVSDQDGAELQRSAGRTFYVRQESIASPPVGPTLRPQPPKPRNNN